nr:cytochrome P450 9e2-like [Megalopta genalis]
MEFMFNMSAFGVLVVTLLVICLTKFLVSQHRSHKYWKERGVPQVPALTLLGITWRMFRKRITMLDYVKMLYNSHADARYVGFMDSFTPTLLIRDPELIREVGIKQFDHFTDHRVFISEIVEPLFGRTVFSLKGESWKKMRNTLSPFFTSSKMKFMFGVVSESSHDFFDYLYNHPDICDMVDAKQTFTILTNDVIASSAFGISVNTLKDRNNEFYRVGTDLSNSFNNMSILRFMLTNAYPRLCKMAGITMFSRASTNFIQKSIADTVRIREKEGIVRPDMIHLLLQAKNEQDSSNITIDDIVAQAFGFFIAGFDTVSTLMSFLTLEMALNQDVQERLREETDRYLAEDNGKISYEALSKMEYMDMVISETQRKNTVVPILDRLCVEEFELPAAGPGYKSVTLKPGDTVWFPVSALHYNPDYFPDPEKFDPERFSEENKAAIVPYTYLPFGIGPRMCIGNRFALMEVKIMMVYLLERFVIEPNEKTKPLSLDRMTFQMFPKDGFWFTLKKRNA